jgi:K+ transporter
MRHVERSRALHETVVLLTVKEANMPVVPEDSRFEVEVLGEGFYKPVVSFGYLAIPRLLPVQRRVAQSGSDPSHLGRCLAKSILTVQVSCR